MGEMNLERLEINFERLLEKCELQMKENKFDLDLKFKKVKESDINHCLSLISKFAI